MGRTVEELGVPHEAGVVCNRLKHVGKSDVTKYLVVQ